MKLLSICFFAVLFIFQAVLGLHLGYNSEIRGFGPPGIFAGPSGHQGPGGPGGPRGPPPPHPPPTNATSSG